MTMTEEQTGAAPTIDLASIVNVEAIYGRALLDEVAAVTAQLGELKDKLRAFMVRATGVVRACQAAERRVYPVHGRIPGLEDELDVYNGLGAVLGAASGLTALEHLAMQVGLEEAIFEAQEPSANPIPGQFAPGVFEAGR